MNFYIPIVILYTPVFIALWLVVGWMWRTVIALRYAGLPLGLSRSEWRMFLYYGPFGFIPVVMLYWDERRARK